MDEETRRRLFRDKMCELIEKAEQVKADPERLRGAILAINSHAIPEKIRLDNVRTAEWHPTPARDPRGPDAYESCVMEVSEASNIEEGEQPTREQWEHRLSRVTDAADSISGPCMPGKPVHGMYLPKQ
jgi:hypothetical protein